MDSVVSAALSVYRTIDIDIGQTWWFNTTRAWIADDKTFYILSLFLAHSLAFYGLNSFYGILTRLKGNKIEDLRFQPGRQVSDELYWDCVSYVTVFHVLAPLMPYFLWDYAIAFHPTMMDDPVPGVVTILWQCVVSYFVTDFLFYWGHRILHWGPLYRSVHKQHHRFYVSMGFAAEYAHPLELALCNIVPVVAGPVLFRFHFAQFVTWLAIAILGTVSGHSGITSPFSEEDGFHDFHHSNNTGNFGSMPHWDRILGTDGAWRKHKAALKALGLTRVPNPESDKAAATKLQKLEASEPELQPAAARAEDGTPVAAPAAESAPKAAAPRPSAQPKRQATPKRKATPTRTATPRGRGK